MRMKNNKIKYVFLSFVCVVFSFMLIYYSSYVKTGVINGIKICGNIIIPSLFIFMTLTTFISLSGLNKYISIPISFITKHLFHLDRHLGCIVLMSFIGGYPVGAKAIATLLDENRIKKETAMRMLAFCTNAGPSFIITAVGAEMFSSIHIGVCFYLSQIIGSIILGVLLSLNKTPDNIKVDTCKDNKMTISFTKAVISSVNALFSMCGFIILFYAILTLLDNCGVINVICTTICNLPLFNIDYDTISSLLFGIIEVTSGCIKSSHIVGNSSYHLVLFLISFSGLSVIFQICSCFIKYNIKIGKFILYRIYHGIITVIVGHFIIKCFDVSIQTSINTVSHTIIDYDKNTPIITILLILMSCVLLFSCGNSIDNNKN